MEWDSPRRVAALPRRSSSPLDGRLYAYLVAHRTPDDPLLEELREEMARRGDRAVMQISPDQGRLLSLLVGVTHTRCALEVGTFTGMSALCIARALPPGETRLVCVSDGVLEVETRPG